MYPDTIFNWNDQSEIIRQEQTVVVDDAPLFMQVFSADKGTEDLVEISGDDFTAMYGTMSFSRHGQSAIQAKRIIDAGGKLYAKRVVAKDSTLANVVLCAEVAEGEDGVTVKWTSQSISGCKTFEDVVKAAEALYVENSVYPLFIYTDNGRGISNKSIRLNPDYNTSKTIGATLYTLVVYEGSKIIEQTTISLDPSVIYANTAYHLDKYTNVQISGIVPEDIYEKYLEFMSNTLAVEPEVMRSYDIVYGYTNAGSTLEGFTMDQESVDLDAENGITLSEGSNGSFGTAPAGTDAWAEAIADVFYGNFSDEVWDVDVHKIALICDANYPDTVKQAIFEFVEFRKDCCYLRDYGVGLKTFIEISVAHDKYLEQHNYFTADYASSYLVKDPETKKNIEVTMLYDMAPLMVNHITKNPYAPMAGTANGFILPEAIKGTVNFTPVNTKKINYKDAIDKLRVNYCVFEDDNCVAQLCYSCQDKYTQLSFINNTIAIQRVLRAVRTACPKQRYTLSTTNDLTNYAKAVNDVLANFVTNFAVLNFVYTQDKLKASQKIFYASIEFAFLNWVQTEIFDVYAINND